MNMPENWQKAGYGIAGTPTFFRRNETFRQNFLQTVQDQKHEFPPAVVMNREYFRINRSLAQRRYSQM
jgi:hypothetical protein